MSTARSVSASPRHRRSKSSKKMAASPGQRERRAENASASWVLPPLQPHQPVPQGTRFVTKPAKPARVTSASPTSQVMRRRHTSTRSGVMEMEFLQPMRRRSESASPTRHRQRQRREKRRSASPSRSAATRTRKAPPAQTRMTFRASGGRVQLTVAQPFVKATRSKLDKHCLLYTSPSPRDRG